MRQLRRALDGGLGHGLQGAAADEDNQAVGGSTDCSPAEIGLFALVGAAGA